MRFFRIVDAVAVPGVLILTWVMLFLSYDISTAGSIAALIGFGFVAALYVAFRELRAHAAASRMASHGDPDELMAHADRELKRRFTRRGRAPFHIYRSIAHQLRGDWTAAKQSLADAGLDEIPPRRRRMWTLFHGTQQINVLAALDDAAGARRVLEETVRPTARMIRGAGIEVMVREAEARVLLAEGKFEEARPLFEQLARDVRLGASTRALCKYYAGQCYAVRDAESARVARAEAAKLAPKTWLARA